MKQNLIKIIGIILVLIVIIICVMSMGNASAVNPNSERIAELTYELSELEAHKNICLDNLPYKESVDNANGIHTYCELYDERMMAVQEEIENLKLRRPNVVEEVETLTGEVEREPGQLNESGDAQVMPEIVATEEHERFKEMASAYGLDAGTIWNVENHYGLTEATILCVTIAETSGGKKGYGKSNPGNVGNNDRGDRVQYALFETGLEKIAQTLNNKYLGSKKTLGCLSNAGHCTEPGDNGKRYATSNGNWERNMVACLSKIYGPIDPSTFNIRNR